MPDDLTTTQPDDVRTTAVNAAIAVIERSLRLMAPHRHLVEEALDAAGEVYAAADAAEVDRMLAETGLIGMEPVSDGFRIRLKHAADIAAGMVSAFDALIEQRGAENYVEWESTVTDPDPENHRRYTFIVVRPGGKTPHQLRQEAERERDDLRARLDRAHDALTRIDEGDTDDFTTLESTVDYVVSRYRAVAAAEEESAETLVRLYAEVERLSAELAAVKGKASE